MFPSRCGIRTPTRRRSRSGTPRSTAGSLVAALHELRHVRAPARARICFVCQHQEFEWVELPGTGTIYTFTVVRHALSPQLADVVPYVSGVIELDGTQGAGARMIANIVDCDPETVAHRRPGEGRLRTRRATPTQCRASLPCETIHPVPTRHRLGD